MHFSIRWTLKDLLAIAKAFAIRILNKENFLNTLKNSFIN